METTEMRKVLREINGHGYLMRMRKRISNNYFGMNKERTMFPETFNEKTLELWDYSADNNKFTMLQFQP